MPTTFPLQTSSKYCVVVQVSAFLYHITRKLSIELIFREREHKSSSTVHIIWLSFSYFTELCRFSYPVWSIFQGPCGVTTPVALSSNKFHVNRRVYELSSFTFFRVVHVSLAHCELSARQRNLQCSANLRTGSPVSHAPKAQLGLDIGYLSVCTEPHGVGKNLN